jgi:hypothetical protein
MKKLAPPQEPRPEVSEHHQKESMVDVPLDMSPLPKRVLDYDLKKIKSFKAIRKNYKATSQKKVFVNDLSVVLDQYPPAEHQLDTDLLVHVLNIAESFFIFGSKEEREEAKAEAVNHLMQKYFRDDADVLDIMIASVLPKVKKSTWLKRLWKRLRIFLKKRPN